MHRSVDSIQRRSYSLDDGGSVIIKCKDLKQLKIEISGQEEFLNVADSLEKLSAIGMYIVICITILESSSFFVVDISCHFAFYYTPGFKAIENGWAMFRPEEEFAKIIHRSDSDWRISYLNQDFQVLSYNCIWQ